MTKVKNIQAVANNLIRAGRSVIPLGVDKRPTIKWKEFQTQIPEVDKFKYTKGIILICGNVSGNLEVVDIDLKHVKNPDLVFKEFKKRVQKTLPELWDKFTIQQTVSGGYHLAYTCRTIESSEVLSRNEAREPIIETRGEGGYVVIAPSRGYKLLQGNFKQVAKITSKERAALLEICRSFDKSGKVNTNERKARKIDQEDVEAIRKDVEIVLEKIERKQIDITEGYENWRNIGFALGDTFGEDGLEYFHRLSQFHPEYDKRECKKQFLDCLHHEPTGERVTISTFFDLAIQHDIEVPKLKTKTKFSKSRDVGSIFRESKPKLTKPPKKLFDSLWGEGELAYLFGEDGAGKSILAVSIGSAIASGKGINGFDMEVKAQPVAYFDAELSDVQFYARYPNGLPKDFKRFTFNEDKQADLVKLDVQTVVRQIEKTATACGAKIIILDNLSALTAMIDSCKTSDSIELMGLLNNLKKKGFSILVIDHTRKPLKESEFKMISKHDLQGSKMKSNLADSVFAIGKSCQGEDVRYIKGIKIRSYEMVFTKSEVATMELKTDPLRLKYVGSDAEWKHVNDKRAQILKLDDEGKAQTEIAGRLGVSQQYVSKVLQI